VRWGRQTASLKRRPLGRYRYVRLRWRVVFAAVDAVGVAVFAAARLMWPSRSGRAAPVRRILLLQWDHLGDSVITTAMLGPLRAAFPDASIEVLAAPWNRAVFDELARIDVVGICERNRFAPGCRWSWIPAAVWWGLRLRRRRYDLAIDVRGEFPHALVLWLSGARRRLGWASGGGGFFLTHAPPYVADRAEVDSRRALLAELGIRPAVEAMRPRFPISARARRRAEALLAGLACRSNGRGLRVVVHIGAGTEAKQWPQAYWRELIGCLVFKHQATIALVGGPGERPRAEQILEGEVPAGVADWTGRLSIAELAAVLAEADLAIGADSGPAHLAAAVGTPVVVLFSGTNHPRQWQPRGAPVRVVRRPVGCSPCHRRECPRPGHPCMRGLGPGEVAAAVEAMLATATATLPQAVTVGEGSEE